MRILIAILLVALGAFPVLLHNNFSFSQMSPVEVAIFIACLLAAALLILVKKIPGKSKEEDSLYQMKFTLSSPSPVVQQGQQLYLRPYMGLGSASRTTKENVWALFPANIGSTSSPASKHTG